MSLLAIPWAHLFGFGSTAEAEPAEPDPAAADDDLPPSIVAHADARERVAALTGRMRGLIAGRVLQAPTDAAALGEIDDVLRSGIIARYMRPVFAHIGDLDESLEEMFSAELGVAERHLALLDASFGEPALEGLRIFGALLPTIDDLHAEIGEGGERAEFDRFLLARGRDPLSYLHEMPVPLARLALAGDRGMVAYLALEGFLGGWFKPSLERAAMLARCFRDGMRAYAILLASLRPEGVPEELVAPEERIDVERLREERREQDQRLARMLAAADADGSAVYAPGEDDA